MNLNKDNLYISKHGENLYSVHIEMPDGSRNYLHNKPTDISYAILIMQDFDGDFSLDTHNVEIGNDGEYYRLNVLLDDGIGKPQIFHSRKLNLNDVIKEYQMLVMSYD